MRVERLFSILIYLLHQKKVTARELADYFEVTTRTIYRDLDTLQMSGVPIISYAGKKGGYTLIDTYSLSAFTFTDEEKEQLLTGLRLQQNIIGIEKTKVLEQKLSLLKDEEDKDTPYLFRNTGIYQKKVTNRIQEKISILTAAIEQRQVVNLEYIAISGDTTKREVYPQHILLSRGSWYLLGFCTLRQEMRQFKITRILNLSVLVTTIPEDFVFKKINTFYEDTSEKTQLQLKFTKRSLATLYDYFLPEEIYSLDEDHVGIEIPVDNDLSILDFLLMFSEEVEILEPLWIREAYIERIKHISAIYQ